MHLEVHLGCKDDVLAPAVATYGPTDDLFGRPIGVEVRGVPESHAHVDRRAEDRLRAFVVQRPLVEAATGVTEAHATQSNPADVQSRVAERRVVHSIPF